jgi:hypothetical protein
LLVHPAIAQSCASAIGGVVADPEGGDRLADVAVGGSDLLCRFGGMVTAVVVRAGITRSRWY